MSDVLKRWRLSRYLSFPLVLVALLLVAAKLVTLQRADLISDLAYRIAHADLRQAQEAVRQLASMPNPPIVELVEATASPNRDIAVEAQHAIGDVLRSIRRNIDGDRRIKTSARQLATLASSLVEQHDNYLAADHEWLERTTQRIIRLANRLPIEATPLVASQCDAVLASIRETDTVASTDESSHDTGGVASDANRVAMDSPELSKSPVPRAPVYDERYAALRTLPAVASVAPDAAVIEMQEAMITLANEGATPSSAGAPSSEGATSWRPRWTHPMLFPVPAVPVEAMPSPTTDSPSAHEPLRHSAAPMEPRLGGNEIEFSQLDSRDLLAQWIDAEGAEAAALEQELSLRGFGRLSRALVEQFFSADVEDRLRLVDRILAEPGVNARPWVMLLAEDPHADVRFMMVTIMASSNDPELIEKAWDVSIHDRDPRIANLAEQLRERRARGQSF